MEVEAARKEEEEEEEQEQILTSDASTDFEGDIYVKEGESE